MAKLTQTSRHRLPLFTITKYHTNLLVGLHLGVLMLVWAHLLTKFLPTLKSIVYRNVPNISDHQQWLTNQHRVFTDFRKHQLHQ